MTLPAHHVARERLRAAIGESRLVIVEAGGGYGKSVFAAELVATHAGPVVRVELTARSGEPHAFVAGLGAATRDAGLLAIELAHDPEVALDELLQALRDQPVLVVVDDVHHLSPTAAALLVALARGIEAPGRLVVAGRVLPEGAERLRPLAGRASLTGVDLALRTDELRALAAALDVILAADQVALLLDTTGGWSAACVLAALRLRRAADLTRELERLAAMPTVLRELVDESLAALDPADADAMHQLARVPLLGESVAAAIGRPGLLLRAGSAGLPLTPRGDGWFELPGPVVDRLRAAGGLRPDAARAIAAVYRDEGEILTALDTLLEAGLREEVAVAIEELPSRVLATFQTIEFHDIVDGLPNEVLAAHPRVLLALARVSDVPTNHRRRAALLDQARALVEPGTPIEREIDAERARDFARDLRMDEAEVLARELLETAGRDELATRARVYDTLAQVHAWTGGDELWHLAEREYEEAIRLERRLGEPTWEAATLQSQAYLLLYTMGRHDRSAELMREAIALISPRPRTRLIYLTMLSEVLFDGGNFAEAEACIDEVFDLAPRVRDPQAISYGWWERARFAAARRDGDALVTALRAAEEYRGDWFTNQTGVYFLGEAAEFCARAGLDRLALDYLERARARRHEAEAQVLMAEAVWAAYCGDPAEAARALEAHAATVDEAGGVEPRELWRHRLLHAYVAWRLGEARAGALAASAFDLAEALGRPELPMQREPQFASALVALAADAGSAAAARLTLADAQVGVDLLGGLRVHRGGRTVPLPPGQPAMLLAYVAASEGAATAEGAVEALWPDGDPEKGAGQLRKVLNRLKKGLADEGVDLDVVVRDGDVLRLAPAVRLDTDAFDDEARRAVRAVDAAIARSAVARYGGEVLPEYRYADWAALTRERARRLYTNCLVLVARDAGARGDIDAALTQYDELIGLEPDDEVRYLDPARLLVAAGRGSSALRYLRRAEAALGELGLDLSPAARACRDDALRLDAGGPV